MIIYKAVSILIPRRHLKETQSLWETFTTRSFASPLPYLLVFTCSLGFWLIWGAIVKSLFLSGCRRSDTEPSRRHLLRSVLSGTLAETPRPLLQPTPRDSEIALINQSSDNEQWIITMGGGLHENAMRWEIKNVGRVGDNNTALPRRGVCLRFEDLNASAVVPGEPL